MKTNQIIIIIFLSILNFSFQTKSKDIPIQEPKVDLEELQSDFMKWWTYYYNNITLSSDFIGLTDKLDTIGKKQFLEELITSNYIPLKLKSSERTDTYKLVELDSSAHEGIGST